MRAARVAIVDSGGTNIASLTNALDRLAVGHTLTADAQVIENASHVILPGVGSAADAMQKLRAKGLVGVLTGLTQPVLGICLGMQLLAESSAEGDVNCLGLIPSMAEKLTPGPGYPVPNMGWCRVEQLRENTLLNGVDDASYFYFVHSYALPLGDYTLATAHHSGAFTAVLQYENFFAAQFHPERSAAAGSRVLSNFLSINA
jgi:glutamine amidotransferase